MDEGCAVGFVDEEKIGGSTSAGSSSFIENSHVGVEGKASVWSDHALSSVVGSKVGTF